MSDYRCYEFQKKVDELLIRHKSILDLLTKYQESCSKVNRAIIKAVTICGCVTIDAQKQQIPSDVSFSELNNFMDTHIKGNLCEACKDKIEEEMGNHLFYLVGICNGLNMDMSDIINKQTKQMETLGKFNLY
ncbi:MAG: DUF1573 domain-containing protein [Anaeromicrobium sp.]|jgi:NTP pyrophosphatase (non-canonical NTP hydrolase)|uniref:DUF1573 domain-containing protein n=1 Tax=Anaeromicrobium sp. TaxID=1929132 RepID=UPI0025F2679D|nr:DUF1573 domain-containing protein [Anaeromicrobium sp.]MCT4593905.1 DUF1573 domain-containing protein [Anaeromicrobium sp.]